MSRIGMANLARQHRQLQSEIDEAVGEVFSSGRFIGGPAVQRFEGALARWLGATSAVGTSSGSTALLAALRGLGIGPGDEVVVPAYTFCATAEAVVECGATPRLADVDPNGNLAPDAAEAAITKRTRALLVVHLFGCPADLERLVGLARRRGLFLVEDCAQAIGGSFQGQLLGTIGAAGCFSFFPAKILGAAGDAGAVVTHDEELAGRLRRIANHGRTGPDESLERGFNYRLDALQAAILEVKLRHLDRALAARRRLAGRYREAFAGLPLELPADEPGHAHQAFALGSEARDALAAHLAEAGIETAVHYRRPLHRQRAFAELPRGPLPEAEALAARRLCLPLYPELSDDEQERIVSAVLRFFGQSVAQ